MKYIIENDVDQLIRDRMAATPFNPSSRVLNIACEDLRVPSVFPKTLRDGQVFGLEIDKKRVEADPLTFYADVDKDRFPFDDNTFDVVLSWWGIEHFQNQHIFKEAERVLKPGGRFIFVTPNIAYPAFLANRFLGHRFGMFYRKVFMRSDYVPHEAYYRFNRYGSIRKAIRGLNLSFGEMLYFGPAGILDYVRTSTFAQVCVRIYERVVTNRLLYRLKPYILVVLEKKKNR